MQNSKETAWKKSRKFGDVKGGRIRPKLADNIFSRAHSIQRPDSEAMLPIFICDNPSRDFFFPISSDEILKELECLPQHDWSGITHIWLRRFKKSEYERNELPLAEFFCGSGVRCVTLYPWPRSLVWEHGDKKPTKRLRAVLDRYSAHLEFKQTVWISHWEEAALKDFYIEYLLFHEVGIHVDWYARHWSKANRGVSREAADQYAFSKTTKRSITYKAETSGG